MKLLVMNGSVWCSNRAVTKCGQVFGLKSHLYNIKFCDTFNLYRRFRKVAFPCRIFNFISDSFGTRESFLWPEILIFHLSTDMLVNYFNPGQGRFQGWLRKLNIYTSLKSMIVMCVFMGSNCQVRPWPLQLRFVWHNLLVNVYD